MPHIALIGMSNIGKSHGARRLAAAGYELIGCDGLIEARLAPELRQEGLHGLRDVAHWMGQPYEPHYPGNSARYLACEAQVMGEVLTQMQDKEPAAVIDTTGSVVYLDTAIQSSLRKAAQVVYLEASAEHTDRLFKRYLDNPKPVIWGDDYAPQEGETVRQSLKRCFPLLLRNRVARYKKLAHVTIPYDQHRKRGADLAALIQESLS